MKKAKELNIGELPKQDKDMLDLMRTVEKNSNEDRADFFKQIKIGYAHMRSAKEFLRKGGGKPNQSDRFIPVVWQYVSNVLAIITSQEVYPQYKMKLHQAENVHQAEISNALFESCREIGRWDETMDLALMTMLVASGCVVGPYLDKVERHPKQIVALRCFNPLQYHCTRGRSFNYAPERMLTYYLDKRELIAYWPQFTSQINELQTVKNLSDDSGGVHGSNKVSAIHALPLTEGREEQISPNAIKVSEMYMRDFGFRSIPKEEDAETAYDENDEFLDSIKAEIGVFPDPVAMIEVYHRHKQHIRLHTDQANMIMNQPWQPQDQVVVGRVLDLLGQHVELHKKYDSEIPEENQGHTYNYERGWHYAVTLNDELMVENGNHPFLEYEIITPPLRELTMEVDAFQDRPVPFAFQFADMAGGLISAYNMTEDILKARLPKIIARKNAIKKENLTNAPDEIIEVETGGSLSEAIQTLEQTSPSPAVFQYIRETKESLEEGSGIFAPMKGKPGGNVRSASQVERLQDAGLIMTDSRMTRLKPSIKLIAIDYAKMLRKILPPEEVLDTVIESINRYVDMADWKKITDIGFSIEVVMKPGNRRISDEKRRAILEIAPVLKNLVPEVPTAGGLIIKTIGEIFKDESPELAKLAEDIIAAQQEMMMKAEEMAKIAAAQGGLPGTQGQNGPSQPQGGASLPMG